MTDAGEPVDRDPPPVADSVPPPAASAVYPTPPTLAPTFQIPTPELFSFSRPKEWPKWRRRFEKFRKTSDLATKDDETQVNTQNYSMGDEADEILRAFPLSEADKKVYKTVIEKLESHFVNAGMSFMSAPDSTCGNRRRGSQLMPSLQHCTRWQNTVAS
jgi:hypothetical protein